MGVNNGRSIYNEIDVSIIPKSASKENKLTTLSQTKKIVRNIAHRGYDKSGNGAGRNKLSSYENLAAYGFDFGECDIKWTIDNVPVCCHDNTFDDATTGETVTIANNTYEELQQYNYYGEKIASFEDVLIICKNGGVGLYIDQNSYLTTNEKRDIVFGIVKKYAMEDNVVWLLQSQTTIDIVQNWYDKSAIGILFYTAISSTQIDLANNAYNGKNYVFLDVDQNRTNDVDLAANNALLNKGVKIEIWSVNNEFYYNKYKPYVNGITSDKLSQYIVDNK